MDRKRWKKSFMQAVKIAVGSSAAIYLAELFQLQFAASAGSIALLTIVTTKWETVKLSLFRLLTFGITVVLAWLTISRFSSEWIAYGLFILILILLCEFMNWKTTVSVNAVIGTHFLTTRDFSREFVLNELWLVLLGISIAIVLNQFHHNSSQKKEIIRSMRYTEGSLQMILGETAAYLSNKDMQRNVWEDIKSLEQKLQRFITDAVEYQGNTFQSHPGYYIDYFEMRLRQCGVLYNLHEEMKKIRQLPRQAMVIAEYVLYLADLVVEHNAPDEQLEKLEGIFAVMKTEPLPATREEFENRAILYHILMDLEEFLNYKKSFVEGLDEEQLRRYWQV